MNGAIDGYVAEFSAALRLPPGAYQRTVDEVAGHLADEAEALVARGLPRDAAEREATGRFGPATLIAARFNERSGRRLALLDLWLRMAALAGFGVLAFGVANILGAPLAWSFGSSFVSGSPPGMHTPLAHCPDLARAYPQAVDCAAAWSQQSVRGGLVGGAALAVLGGAGATAAWLLRRRYIGRAARRRTRAVYEALATAGFTLLAVLLLSGGLAQTVSGSAGDHRWLPLSLMLLAVMAGHLAARRRARQRQEG